MSHRSFLSLLVLLGTLIAVSPALAEPSTPTSPSEAVVTAPANDDATELTAPVNAERPGPVVKEVLLEAEAMPVMNRMVVVRDAESGGFRAPTAEEWSRLAPTMDPLNRSYDGLVEKHYADGTVGVTLNGRFQNMMMMRKSEATGKVEALCTHGAEHAAGFMLGQATEAQNTESEDSDVR